MYSILCDRRRFFFKLRRVCFDRGCRGPYYARAMGDPLRDRRPVKELTDKSQDIEISAKIGDFERLCEAIDDELGALPAADVPGNWRDANVAGRLSFGHPDQQGRVLLLEGHVETSAVMVCQRCLSTFEWPLSTDLKLQLGVLDQLVDECDGYELWELDDDSLRPIDIVDEALTISLPFSAVHQEPAECTEISADVAGTRMTTPFASLRSRMDAGKQN